jgi:hypothetical protein
VGRWFDTSPRTVLRNNISVEGIYRLSEASTADLDEVLAAPPGRPITSSRISPALMGDTLF